jgi:hypothetical protein
LKYLITTVALGLILAACGAPKAPVSVVPKDPEEVAIACTRSASDRLNMGEPAFNIYNECVQACKETTSPDYCTDQAKSWIGLSESIKELNSQL